MVRGPVTLAHVAKRFTVELSLPVLSRGMSRLEFEQQTFRMRGDRSNRMCDRGSIKIE